MKTIFKVFLPVLAFVLASAAAVGTHDQKVAYEADSASLQGFIQNPNAFNCLEVTVDCTTTNTGQICMSSEAVPRQVWLKNTANACNRTLYKVIH